jgi:hypothetical protein
LLFVTALEKLLYGVYVDPTRVSRDSEFTFRGEIDSPPVSTTDGGS